DRHGLHARRRRRLHEGLLSGGFEHRHLRDHGARPPRTPGRPLRSDGVMATVNDYVAARAPARAATLPRHQVVAFLAMVALLVIAPFFVYPIFLMKALCFALFACAFNLLI